MMKVLKIEQKIYFHLNNERDRTLLKLMMWLVLLWKILLIALIASEECAPSRSNNEIVVAFSKRPPFVYQDQNGALKGLDILIIENFAKKAKLRVKYKEFNGSLNVMINRVETFENVLMSSVLR